jgi:hypothetical protein
MKITFTDLAGVAEAYKPVPASEVIPEWYKSLDSYVGKEKKPNGQGTSTSTVKRCMPVFDSITMGYIIFTVVDLWISQKDGQPYYEWPSLGPIEFHPIVQAPTHPNRNGHQESYPKWINPWAIKTEPGYSVLFVPPMHRESVFTILPGVVDTDKYDAAVNFPFVLNDINYKGLIPAGTPIAQVIPFKRESWKMQLGSKKEIESINKTNAFLKSKFFDGYKNYFRSNKEYK